MRQIDQTVQFEAVPIEPGLSDFSRDFQPDLALANESYNVQLGTNEGIGPRYGFLPIHKHMTTDEPVIQAKGMAASEGGTGFYTDRVKCVGVVKASWNNKDYYIWACASASRFDWCLSATYSSGYTESSDIRAGITRDDYPSHITTTQMVPTNYKSIFRDYTAGNYDTYAQLAVLTVRKGDEPSPFLVVNAWNNFQVLKGMINETIGNTMGFGLNPYFYGPIIRYSLKTRKTVLHSIGIVSPHGYALIKSREYDSFTGKDSNSNRVYRELSYLDARTANKDDVDFTNVSGASVVARIDAVNPESSSVNTRQLLVYDPELQIGSVYSVIVGAFAGKAFGALVQEQKRGTDNNVIHYFDPAHLEGPKNRQTLLQYPGGNYFDDRGPNQSSCWKYFGQYDTSLPGYGSSHIRSSGGGTGPSHMGIGPSGSGVLQNDTTYEFTFSYYNKLTGHETNVGTPARHEFTQAKYGAINNFAISLYRPLSYNKPPVTLEQSIPWEVSVNGMFGLSSNEVPVDHVNHMKIRVYYRELGTFEWLPAADIDLAEHLFNPNQGILYACKDPLALSLGGQPGGFNDYSPLPDDIWIDVLEYKSRLFWFSEKQMIFSLRDDPFSYPIRNSTTLASGIYRGAKVHAFPGQSQQDSRLVVWSDKDQYVGVFKGSGFGVTQVIPISSTTTGEFELDGSDFFLDLRSAYGAFSSRAAVIADGYLYWWGPQGILEDNGVDFPSRISLEIDKQLKTLVDQSKIDRICCEYNDETKEIIWFYPPQSGSSKTKALVFNRRIRKFYHHDIPNTYVDWVTALNLTKTTAYKSMTGRKLLVGSRSSTVQRPAFYDRTYNAGDMFTQYELLASACTPVGGTTNQFDLTFAATPNLTALKALIATGQILTISDSETALEGTTSSIVDCKCTVVSVAAGSVRVTAPVNLGTYSAAANSLRYIPIYISSIHGIPYLLKTRYWAPAGMRFWGWWKHCHFVFKVNTIPGASTLVTFAHKPPQTDSVEASYSLDLTTPNCDGFHQIMRALSAENHASTGQGLRFSLSGVHTGGEWALQYAKFEVVPQPAGELMQFEG